MVKHKRERTEAEIEYDAILKFVNCDWFSKYQKKDLTLKLKLYIQEDMWKK